MDEEESPGSELMTRERQEAASLDVVAGVAFFSSTPSVFSLCHPVYSPRLLRNVPRLINNYSPAGKNAKPFPWRGKQWVEFPRTGNSPLFEGGFPGFSIDLMASLFKQRRNTIEGDCFRSISPCLLKAGSSIK